MSTDEDSLGSPLSPATPIPVEVESERQRDTRGKGKRNTTDLLRHQQSFEARYSSIIQKQIWETTINKDVMERQLNAYFPFARSASLSKDGTSTFHQLLTPDQETSANQSRSLGTTPVKQRGQACLEKLDTLDVAEKQHQQQESSREVTGKRKDV